MGARGAYIAQEHHVVNLIPPVDVNGGKTTAVFNMKNFEHATIILQFGVESGAPSKVSLLASDNQSPENTTAIGFDVFKCETAYNVANGDVLAARVACTAAAGFAPAAASNIFYVLEIDAASLPNAAQHYIKLVVATPGAACLSSAIAILSGARFNGDQSDTALT